MATPRSSASGALIGGRFRREANRGADVRGTWWQGSDMNDGTPVEILIVDPPAAEAVADSAIRAKVLSDPAFPAIVEVIRPTKTDPRGYVITERTDGTPLAHHLTVSGPMGPGDAARVVSDVSEALAQAERAGIRHGNLRPDNVLIRDDGTVQLTGIGFAGDLAGVAEKEAAGVDLRSLAGLLYATLTGYWPQAAPASRALPVAPTLNGMVVPPAQITTGVGADLSQLAMDGLSPHPTGATSAADMAHRLAPRRTPHTTAKSLDADAGWYASPSDDVPLADDEMYEADDSQDPGTLGSGFAREDHDGSDPEVQGENQDPGTQHPEAMAAGGLAAGAAGGGLLGRWFRRRRDEEPEPAPHPMDELDGDDDSEAAGQLGRSDAVDAQDDPQDDGRGGEPGRPVFTEPHDTADIPVQSRQSRPEHDETEPSRPQQETGSSIPAGTAIGAAAGPEVTGPETTGPEMTGSQSTGPQMAGPEMIPADSAQPSAGAHQDAELPAQAGSSPLGGAPQRARAAMASAVSSPVAVRATQQVRAAGGSAQRMMDRLHPDIPHLTDEEKRTRTKAVVGILGAGMALALILSLISILTLFGRKDEIAQSLQPTVSASTTAKAPARAASTPVVIAVTAEDPLGDKEENDDRADLVIDRKPGTSWVTSRYNTRDFGGLKSGVGLMLTLRATSPVKQVTIRQPGEGGRVEIRNAPKGTLEGSTVVGSSDLSQGDTTITLGSRPVTKNILIWFTSLPRTDGAFRAQVSEITVS